MAYESHVKSAKDVIARCAVVTLSDTRTVETDGSGKAIQALLREAGHEVVTYQVVKDDPSELAPLLEQLLADDGVDAVLTNGGTGIARRDQTIEVVERALERPLPGFGELFRMLS